jgi:hypothetical protein
MVLLGVPKKPKMPPEVADYFARMGAEGGRIGGRARAERMTAEERSAGARLASRARWVRQKAKPGDKK